MDKCDGCGKPLDLENDCRVISRYSADSEGVRLISNLCGTDCARTPDTPKTRESDR
jgi:hypothetical protein